MDGNFFKSDKIWVF